jgi:hypothetical protein
MTALFFRNGAIATLLIGWLIWTGESWDQFWGVIGTPQTTYRPLTFDEAPDKHQRQVEVLRGQDPRLFRLLEQTSFLNGRVMAEGEVAYSTPDSTALEGLGHAQRRMIRFGVTGEEGVFRYGLTYRSAGKTFATLQDQALRELWGEGRYGIVRLRVSQSETWNNVDREPSRARLRQVTDRMLLAIARPNWPELTLSYSRGISSSELEPASVLPVRNRMDTLEGALSYGWGDWTAKLSSTYSLTRDLLNPAIQTEGLLHAVSGSYRPVPSLTLAPSVTFREDRKRWSGARSMVPAAALSLTYAPSHLLRLAASGSYSATHSSDGLIGNNTVTASGTAAWTVEKSATSRTTLSFEVAYRGFKDELSPRLSNEDLSGLILLEINGF